MTTLEKAIKIIVSNEGNYSSINPNDNGALSIGICQWHGNRAKELLKKISKELTKREDISIIWLKNATENYNWNAYIPSTAETSYLVTVLCTGIAKEQQDKQAKKDVQGYINAVMKYDITDENAIIFLSDICNQGGTGAIKRIINNTFEGFGKHATLDDFMHTALMDKVFKNYKLRRYKVYKALTGKDYFPTGQVYFHTVVKNETLSAIALRYDTTVRRLVVDNEIDNPNKIYVGQKIRIMKGV